MVVVLLAVIAATLLLGAHAVLGFLGALLAGVIVLVVGLLVLWVIRTLVKWAQEADERRLTDLRVAGRITRYVITYVKDGQRVRAEDWDYGTAEEAQQHLDVFFNASFPHSPRLDQVYRDRMLRTYGIDPRPEVRPTLLENMNFNWRDEAVANTSILDHIRGMSLNLSDDEIEALLAYARDKFEDERYPFAPALRPVRDVLAKIDPKPKPEPPAPKKPYVPSLLMVRKKRR